MSNSGLIRGAGGPDVGAAERSEATLMVPGWALFAWAGSNTTRTMTADALYLTPWTVCQRLTFSGYTFEVTTGHASSVVSSAVWAANPVRTGLARKIYEFPDVAATAAAVYTATTAPITLEPGRYWHGMISRGASITARTIVGASVDNRLDAALGANPVVTLRYVYPFTSPLPSDGSGLTIASTGSFNGEYAIGAIRPI